MRKRKQKLHIDIETQSFDPGKIGKPFIVAYQLGSGPVEVLELDPAQPGTDVHRFAEEYLNEGYDIRESLRKAFKKAKVNAKKK